MATSSQTGEADVILGPLVPQQLYEQIEQRLIDWILEGRLKAGERLPSERDLAARLAVSRASVREAIGALQVRGIVQTRHGAGSYLVKDASARILGRPEQDPIADVGPFALLQAREALEPGIARAAAERARASQYVQQLLAQMSDALDPTDAGARDAWNEADRLFHRELAVLTENPVFVSLADQVALWMDQPLWRRLRDDLISVPGRMSSHVAEHRLIYQEIVEGQVEAAGFQAINHLRRVGRQMRETNL